MLSKKFSFSPDYFILRLVAIARGGESLLNEAGLGHLWVVWFPGVVCRREGCSGHLRVGSDVQSGHLSLCHSVSEFHTNSRNQKQGSHSCFVYRQYFIRQ